MSATATATATTTKPQDAEFSPAKTVVKGDTLETKVEFLTSAPLKIEWSQRWVNRSETYYYVVFENISQGR